MRIAAYGPGLVPVGIVAQYPPTRPHPCLYTKSINERDTPMTNYTLTPALTDAVMARYDAATGGMGYFGADAVAPAWAYCADGFSGSLDDLVSAVADFLVQED